ncbi:MAG: hypothetical protein NTU98_09140 [Bacteroidetes bacterium]|nr:hypothetical protein [Bacteroidota bacterium]
MKTKPFQFIVPCLFLLLFSSGIRAQQVIVTYQQPPPNQWNAEDLWALSLTNTTDQTLLVYLHGTVQETTDGLVFEGTSAQFVLAPHYSGRIESTKLQPVDVGYANSAYEEMVLRTGTLPEGLYEICITVHDANTDEEIGKACIFQPIAHTSPPELLTPVNESHVDEPLPVFLWLPVTPLSPGALVTYSIKIIELMDGQVPIEAVESNPAFYTYASILSTSYQLPISAKGFEPGRSYAWQVTAMRNGYEVGNSQVWSFTYTRETRQCELYKADIGKPQRADTLFYALVITNNYHGTSEEYTPVGFRLSIQKGLINSVSGDLPKDWVRSPEKMPPPKNQVIWTTRSGQIPNGETSLGLIYLGNSVVTPNYFLCEWMNADGIVICKDSSRISDQGQGYHDLSEKQTGNYTGITSDTLKFQFYSKYASVANIGIGILEVETMKLMPSVKKEPVKIDGLNGLNRISVNLKDYKLSPETPYLLKVSDQKSTYYLPFKVISKNEK